MGGARSTARTGSCSPPCARELGRRGLALPVAWGNRNWAPYVVDALRELHEAGARRVVVVTTSAYSSYSSCRQYREDLGRPRRRRWPARAGHWRSTGSGPTTTILASSSRTSPPSAAALAALPAAVRAGARLVFVTHSIPEAMDRTSGPGGGAYAAQHRELAAEIAARVG